MKKGLEWLQALPDTPRRDQTEVALQLALGNALIAARGHGATEVGQAFTRARELCRDLGEPDQLYQALDGLYRFYLARPDMPRSLELGKQFLKLAQSQQDRTLLLSGHRKLGTSYMFIGQFALAEKHLGRVLELYDRQIHQSYVRLFGQDPAVTCLNYAAIVDWHLGFPDRARKRTSEALGLARELAHPFSLAVALCFSCHVYRRLREPGTVQKLTEEAAELADKHGFAMWSALAMLGRGWALGAQGSIGEGLAHMRKGMAASSATGSRIQWHVCLAQLAELFKEAGRIDEGLEALSEALATVDSTEERIWEPELYRLKGEMLLLQEGAGNESAAEACYWKALEISRQQMDRMLELRAMISLSRLLQAKGEGERARRMLAETTIWFTEGFGTADLVEAQRLLEELA